MELVSFQDLLKSKSRGQQLFGEDWEKQLLDKDSIPKSDILYLHCPRHESYFMTPLKIYNSGYGIGIKFQCHASSEDGRLCLIRADIYEDVVGGQGFLKPGDILLGEDWDKALQEIEKHNMGLFISDPQSANKEIVLAGIPPNPFSKSGSLSAIIWESFWKNMYNDKYVSYKTLEEEVLGKKSSSKTQSQLRKWTLGDIPLTDWMTDRTGFVFKVSGETWKIVDRRDGKDGWMPWDDEDYRIKFGFEQT